MKNSAEKLKIITFGSPAILLDEQPLTGFISNKAPALVYYLAATNQSHSRSALAGLLWGDSDEQKARKNLRDVLSNLRRVMGDYLLITRQTVSLNTSAINFIDVQHFESSLNDIEAVLYGQLTPATVAVLQETVDLYQGEFLEGFQVPQAADYEIWLVAERARCQQRALNAYHILTKYLTQQGNTAVGIHYAMQLLNIEPWREETHRQLMSLLVWSGQRSAALAQYQTCRRILQENLGVEPQVETRQLYERILRGDIILKQVGSSSDKDHPEAVPHNLPSQLTRFVGRETELAAVIDKLDNPNRRLLTITGPGGVGKTRLALQVAQQLLAESKSGTGFADGIYFVRLAAIEYRDLNKSRGEYNPLAAAIADALQLTLNDPDAPTTRLQNYLREKRMLLIMDNFEHLSAASNYLTILLTTAPKVKMLVTSRSRLSLRGEQTLLLDGLPYPTETTQTLSWQSYSAVQLFLQTARTIDTGFRLTPPDEAAITKICKLVNGLPLGIELAATWVRVLPCSDIVGELEINLRFLQASMRDVPERHRSLWAVFTYSWNLLTAEEQRALRQLSVFRGGFDRQAAEFVTEASLIMLSKLVDHSFIKLIRRETDAGRFELLEVLRLYAAEQLRQNLAEEALTYDRHRDYFMNFLKEREAGLQGPNQTSTLDQVGEEIQNIRSAWRWSVAQKNISALDAGLRGMFDYYDMRSRFQEGRSTFQQAAETLAEVADTPETQLIYARLLARQGWFAFHVGKHSEATKLLAKSVDILRPLNSPTDLIFSLNYLGAVHFHLGRTEKAHQLCHEALTLSQDVDYPVGTGIALNILSQIAYRWRDFDQAQQYGQQSLAIVTRLGNPWSRAFSLSNLAQVALASQDFAEAKRLNEIILTIREELGDLRGMAMCLQQLARTAVAQKDVAEAQALYQHSLLLYRDIGNQQGIILTLSGLAHLALKQKDYALAKTYYLDALQRALQLENAPDLTELITGLSTTFHKMGQPEAGVQLEPFLERGDKPQLKALLESGMFA